MTVESYIFQAQKSNIETIYFLVGHRQKAQDELGYGEYGRRRRKRQRKKKIALLIIPE